MNSFIEEFYYGNIDPQARRFEQNKKVQHDISFITGFRLGAQFAFDTFVTSKAPYSDDLKDEI